jgi:hypothetical protein
LSTSAGRGAEFGRLNSEEFAMTQESFDGAFYRRGIGGDPVVFIDASDHARFNQWFSTHSIFTKIMSHPHPTTGASCPTVYISKTAAEPFRDGDPVTLTIDVRPEKRGNGIKIVNVV